MRVVLVIMLRILTFFLCLQPQNEHIELHQKRHGRQFNYFEKRRKREARSAHTESARAKKLVSVTWGKRQRERGNF